LEALRECIDSLAGTIDNIEIAGNNSLSTCEVQSICDYLVSMNGSVNIYDNASGCNNPHEVAINCGITLPPCLPNGNYYFTTQDDVDNFTVNYPGCTELEGDVIINGSDITNLAGLSGVTSIGGGLNIWDNPALTSLTGLEGLTSIGGGLGIANNDALTSMIGLENLISIGGNLFIHKNVALNSLIGLENIDGSSIDNLTISENNELSTCAVQSICDYLVAPGGYVEIRYNALGCYSIEEVEEACESLPVSEHLQSMEFSFFPNPARHEVSISAEGYVVDKLSIYTLTGQLVLQKRPLNGTVDISDLQPGMYIVEVTVEGRKLRQKLLVQR